MGNTSGGDEAELRRLHVTVSRRFLDKIEAARSALSHARPGASTEEILEAGLDLLLDLLLARDAKKKGQVVKPSSMIRPARADRVPAHVRREVWRRDGLMDCFTRNPGKNRAARGGDPDQPGLVMPSANLAAPAS